MPRGASWNLMTVITWKEAQDRNSGSQWWSPANPSQSGRVSWPHSPHYPTSLWCYLPWPKPKTRDERAQCSCLPSTAPLSQRKVDKGNVSGETKRRPQQKGQRGDRTTNYSKRLSYTVLCTWQWESRWIQYLLHTYLSYQSLWSHWKEKSRQGQRQNEAQNGQDSKPTLKYFQLAQSVDLYEFYLNVLKKIMSDFHTESRWSIIESVIRVLRWKGMLKISGLLPPGRYLMVPLPIWLGMLLKKCPYTARVQLPQAQQ